MRDEMMRCFFDAALRNIRGSVPSVPNFFRRHSTSRLLLGSSRRPAQNLALRASVPIPNAPGIFASSLGEECPTKHRESTAMEVPSPGLHVSSRGAVHTAHSTSSAGDKPSLGRLPHRQGLEVFLSSCQTRIPCPRIPVPETQGQRLRETQGQTGRFPDTFNSDYAALRNNRGNIPSVPKFQGEFEQLR